jgi:acetylglutamate kinase
MPILLNKTIRLFLDSIGRREEYEFYLRRFQTDQTQAFAILCPFRAGFEDVVTVFNFDLHFLLRLELSPVILLCGSAAPEMRDLMFAEDHPYDLLDVSATGSGFSCSEMPAFFQRCRDRHKAAVLYHPQEELDPALLQCVPGIARRVHLIRVRGPLHNAQGQPLAFHYTQRPTDYTLDEQDQWPADLAAHLLDAHPGTHISVASPWNLLQELFTVKGAGCVIRKGSVIHRFHRDDAYDRERLNELMEQSFNKKLHNPHWLDAMEEIYLEQQYRGAALLERHEPGMYLSKFAVGTQARGEGLANELWQEIIRDHAALFWRARLNNPINHWYERHADGSYQDETWRVFWRGIHWRHLSDIIDYALHRPDDFSAPGA